MFQVRHRSTQALCTVYSVHKCGPAHEQTKFLVHSSDGWQWDWAIYYVPVQQTSQVPTPPRAAVARTAEPAPLHRSGAWRRRNAPSAVAQAR